MFIIFIMYVYILVVGLILCLIVYLCIISPLCHVKMLEQRTLEEPYFAIFYHNHFCSEGFFVLFVEAVGKTLHRIQ